MYSCMLVDISLNNLVVFVGNNNSGKTMVMQLIYGIREALEHFPVPVSNSAHSTRLPTTEHQNDNISKDNSSLTWLLGWFLKCSQVRQRIFAAS